ncbi:hypothetical protein BgAZ_402330 [Babesia gibsoni]|uniref:Uncharacterized protein n=1 Tax=Babesia gibsoni TaxID=33632 RepID=A0AAD8PCN2_BABGI|nr:hypothetical protein BgAZ_402330 [Babesia gibsoni]
MWNRARVRTTSLQALGQLARLSRRYKIEKIQRLSANFEKACWRSVRCAEERAYHQKYAFLRHCVNVINARRGEAKELVIPLENTASQIAKQYNGHNANMLIKKTNAKIESLFSELPPCLNHLSAKRPITTDKATIIDICINNGLSQHESQKAVINVTEIAKLEQVQPTKQQWDIQSKSYWT